mmetsp:Transcript_36078/g.75922  ORF Transcript_36078/g.75922 Transcript_36078/m.75922 type:complete len:80 (+) Transcript_36078:429-668(+)
MRTSQTLAKVFGTIRTCAPYTSSNRDSNEAKELGCELRENAHQAQKRSHDACYMLSRTEGEALSLLQPCACLWGHPQRC